MNIDLNYLCSILNTTVKMTTPILFATLAAAICNKVSILNISMEGGMLAGAFFSIVVNYYTHNIFLAVLAGIVASVAVSMVVAYCIIYLKGNAVVVGLAANTMMSGLTIFLLFQVFHTRGVFTDPSLSGLSKLSIPVIENIPYISLILDKLTYVDYLSLLSVVIIYVFLYKTVLGYRIRAIGINKEAAKSLGTPVEKYQFWVVSLSGVLCGLGGVLLSMGSVTLFIQNITSGKGYIAMAANNLGASHPLGVMLSSFFFGFTNAIGTVMQQSIKTQITASIPYASTIIALCVFAIYDKLRKKQMTKKMLKDEKYG